MIRSSAAHKAEKPVGKLLLRIKGPGMSCDAEIGLLHDFAGGRDIPRTVCGVAEHGDVVAIMEPAPRIVIAIRETTCQAGKRLSVGQLFGGFSHAGQIGWLKG